jgi:hypothetical protein
VSPAHFFAAVHSHGESFIFRAVSLQTKSVVVLIAGVFLRNFMFVLSA